MFAHGSKSRLTEKDLGRFAGDTLFDRIGRTVCRAGVLPRKELFEAWEVARRARRLFRGGRAMDLAGGHGLLAHVMLLLDDTSPRAVVVDTTIPPSAARLHDVLVEAWPRLRDRVAIVASPLDDVALHEDDVVVSSHACGALTDVILAHAIGAHVRVAVLPCCHDVTTCDAGTLTGWMDAALAIDARRAIGLESAGYRVWTQTIPAAITPKNRLLLGAPVDDADSALADPGAALGAVPFAMTVAERINAERVVLAGWSRAILLQLAHPLVAQGVADHSTFRAGLLTAAVRLHHTVAAMRRLTFGTVPEAQGALDRIMAIHRRVNGTLREAVGPYPAATRYDAEDPALVLWVHATLMDSLPLVYEALVAPLSGDERDAWCRESAPVARALGAGDDVPQRWEAVQAYLGQMYASGRIIVGPTARALATDVLAPRLSTLIAPVRAVNRIVTVGLLPAQIREQYGLEWHERDEVRLQRVLRLLRATRRVTPTVLAHWPDARARR